MSSDRRRLKRARLLERVRTVEQRVAAAEAQRAESVSARLEQLSRRSAAMAGHYLPGGELRDAADLRDILMLGHHLRQLGDMARRQAGDARMQADRRLAELAVADRRLKHSTQQHRSIADALSRESGDAMSQARRGQHRKAGTLLD